jgi:hypothetical protein
MELLSFDGSPRRGLKNKNRTTRIAIAVAGMAIFAALGSTLAANITINTGNPVQFGQGLTATAACSNMTIAPQDTFTNGNNNGGTFTLSNLVFSQINATSCANDTLTIKAWDSAISSAALTLGTNGSNYSQIDVAYNASGTPTVAPNQATLTNITGTTASQGFTLNMSGAGAAIAGNVYKITVESHQ